MLSHYDNNDNIIIMEASTTPSAQNFLDAVLREQRKRGEKNIALLPNDRIDHDSTVPINSIVFTFGDEYLLAVISQQDMVNVTLLEDLVLRELGIDADERSSKISLASSDEVQQLCGFAPGTVPPIGHHPRVTVLDKSLAGEKRPLVGGGGIPHYSLQLSVSSVLERENTIVGDIRRKVPDQTLNEHGERRGTVSVPLARPYFVVAPPSTDEATNLLTDKNLQNVFVPSFVSAVGRIGGVRRMARRLVFCDLLPIHLTEDERHPWKSPTDNREMAVQLIAGKTLCQNRNDDRGESLRALKSGMIVSIVAKTNVGNRDSLHNWVSQRSLDLVVYDYQLLYTLSPKDGSPNPENVAKFQLPKYSSPSKATLKSFDLYPDVSIFIVDDIRSLKRFSEDVQKIAERLDASAYSVPTELVGLDCEWKPKFLAGDAEPQPVLLLQLSFHSLRTVFLLDVQTLLRPLLDPSHSLDETESLFDSSIKTLFSSSHFVKVGFQLAYDLQKLAASYPHISSLQTVHSVLDVSVLAKKTMHLNEERNSRVVTSSLSRLCEYFLGKSLNKEEQVSNWSFRPLTEGQIEYASLDAIVTPVITDRLLKSCAASFGAKPVISRWEGDTSFARMLTSLRFIFLDQNVPDESARKINAKALVGHLRLVTQSWVTGNDSPRPPKAPSDGEMGTYTDTQGTIRVSAQSINIEDEVKDFVIDASVGNYVGKTKDRCLSLFLKNSSALENGSRLDFPHRSGFVEFDNMVALFVNFPANPGRGRSGRFPNEWLEDGSILTWFMRENEWKRGESVIAQKLLPTNGDLPTVVLYIRQGKGNFLCCGRCRCVHLENTRREVGEDIQDWTLVKLHLLLLDWNRLNESRDFRFIVGGVQKNDESDEGDLDY